MTKVQFGVPLQILGGVCNSADLCKKRKCPYRKISTESTRKFCKLLALRYEGKEVEESRPPKNCPMRDTLIFD
jgi:hypothetical protein